MMVAMPKQCGLKRRCQPNPVVFGVECIRVGLVKAWGVKVLVGGSGIGSVCVAKVLLDCHYVCSLVRLFFHAHRLR